MLDTTMTLTWWQVAIGAFGVVVMTVLVTTIALRLAVGRSEPELSHPASIEPAREMTVTPGTAISEPFQEKLDVLIRGLIGVFDLASGSPAIRGHIKHVLRGTGVVAVSVEPGIAFDPAEHLAIDTEPAAPGKEGQVARQVRPGWASGETLLRPVEVVVWTSQA